MVAIHYSGAATSHLLISYCAGFRPGAVGRGPGFPARASRRIPAGTPQFAQLQIGPAAPLVRDVVGDVLGPAFVCVEGDYLDRVFILAFKKVSDDGFESRCSSCQFLARPRRTGRDHPSPDKRSDRYRAGRGGSMYSSTQLRTMNNGPGGGGAHRGRQPWRLAPGEQSRRQTGSARLDAPATLGFL
jgi:hypothetical protein